MPRANLMKVGDLVRYNCSMSGKDRVGFVTDIFDYADGCAVDRMYEVICSDPFDRGWYNARDLKVIVEKK